MLKQSEFIYFAYGSNMSAKRLAARTPSARMLTTGSLSGYRLVFDKVSKDESGKCDSEMTGVEDDRVYGALYAIDDSERSALDKAGGAGAGYEARHIDVETRDGTFKTLTYIATNKRAGLLPYHWYKNHVLAGARQAGLPESYIAAIEQCESMEDFNSARTAREWNIRAASRVAAIPVDR